MIDEHSGSATGRGERRKRTFVDGFLPFALIGVLVGSVLGDAIPHWRAAKAAQAERQRRETEAGAPKQGEPDNDGVARVA